MKQYNTRQQARLAIRRRDLIAALGGAAIAWPLARAQGQAKRPLIAILALQGSAGDNEFVQAFVESLGKLGYVDGRTATIAARFAAGDPQALPKLAAELAQLRPNVIMADVASPIKAILKEAPGVPIVGATMGSPVAQGLATSFAHPGGNVTGIASQVEEIDQKLFEIALEIIPNAKSFGALLNPEGDVAQLYLQELQAAADKRKITFHAAEARAPSEIEGAIRAIADAGSAFIVTQPNGLLNTERYRIAELAIKAHLPVMSNESFNAEAGDLLCYGIDYIENYRRAAVFVDKILKGAKPGDLPIEFPTKIEIIINLKTAKALGITISQSLLARADRVIE